MSAQLLICRFAVFTCVSFFLPMPRMACWLAVCPDPDRMARRLCVFHSLFNKAFFGGWGGGGGGCFRSTGKQIWNLTWNEHKIIARIYYLNYNLNTVFILGGCPVRELQKQCPPWSSWGKASACCSSPPACEKTFLLTQERDMLFVDCLIK